MSEHPQTVYPYFMAVPGKLVAKIILGNNDRLFTDKGINFLVDFILKTHQEYMTARGKFFNISHIGRESALNVARMHLMACVNCDPEFMNRINDLTDKDFFNVHTANLDAWEFYKSVP